MAINLDVHGNTNPLESAVDAAVKRIRSKPIRLTVDDKGVTQPLGNMKRGADEFSKSMEAANARIIAFGASMAIINGVGKAFKALIVDAIAVEKSLQDINVVMGLSSGNLDKFSAGLFKVAKETGAAFNVAAEAATEYARQGLSMEESLKRTRDALILTRITGMDSANAVQALTAAMNTYGHQIKDTTELVSKFAAVDVKFAVSAEDFADAISRTGAAAKGAGVDIDQLIGIVTAAQQQTARGGKVIGNSLKTIFTRIGKTSTLDQLENVGIAVRDLQGNSMGAIRILTDLANTFDKLSAAQQAQTAQSVGGVFQINILKAVLSDAAKQNGIMSQATGIASNATDDAIKKNEMLRETMSALAAETGLALKEVSAKIGEIMLAPGMEKVLNMVKGIAEGMSDMLGDGEGTGDKFAKGFLGGLGNILTGPGLVVLTAVFGKLLFKGFQYAQQSLKSLIGITSETSKQKAIQSSLVGLFGRSNELTKEMLRTDIGRVEKEKIILKMLREQVAEAAKLDAMAMGASRMLYKRGYGENLTPKKAGGYIPNFSERDRAAKGGYAAGNIREMNMPGAGAVIYNSAEQVKNFPGMKQPGILPPKGSKAGKNYRQGFASAHGFDPYAAGGYIPNYEKEDLTSGFKQASAAGLKKKGNMLDLTNMFTMLTLTGGTSGQVRPEGIQPKGSLYGLNPKDMPHLRFGIASLKGDAAGQAGDKKLATDLDGMINAIKGPIAQHAAQWGNQFNFGNKVRGANKGRISKLLSKGSIIGGADGAMSSVVGTMFEAALGDRMPSTIGRAPANIGKSAKGPGENIGGDFDVRGISKNNILRSLFAGAPIADTADYKATANDETKKSFVRKIAKEMIIRRHPAFIPSNKRTKGHGLIKSRDPKKKGSPIVWGTASGEGHYGRNPTKPISLPMEQLQMLGNALGFVPNYANPLGDAISRERGAGVPVSQIRVGSHPGLMNRVNPGGLGVTNTRDEPRGLRDVFGATGMVPNYAVMEKLGSAVKGAFYPYAALEKYEKQLAEAQDSLKTFDDEHKTVTNQVGIYEKGLENANTSLTDLKAEQKALGASMSTATNQDLNLIDQEQAALTGLQSKVADPGYEQALRDKAATDKRVNAAATPEEALSVQAEVVKEQKKVDRDNINAKKREIADLETKLASGKGTAEQRDKAKKLQIKINTASTDSMTVDRKWKEEKEKATQLLKRKKAAETTMTEIDKKGGMDKIQAAAQRNATKRGMAGMAFMMAAPMLGGMVEEMAPKTSVAGRGAAGALSGGATGASMGMMVAPLLGPLAPFAPAIGAAIGGLKGLFNGMKEAEKATRAYALEKFKETKAKQLVAQTSMIGSIDPGIRRKMSERAFKGSDYKDTVENSEWEFEGRTRARIGGHTRLGNTKERANPNYIKNLEQRSWGILQDMYEENTKIFDAMGIDVDTEGTAIEFEHSASGVAFGGEDRIQSASKVLEGFMNKMVDLKGHLIQAKNGQATRL